MAFLWLIKKISLKRVLKEEAENNLQAELS
jgi:hypothetical protein